MTNKKGVKSYLLIGALFVTALTGFTMLPQEKLQTVQDLHIELGEDISPNIKDYLLTDSIDSKNLQNLLTNTKLEILDSNNSVIDGTDVNLGNYTVKLTYKNEIKEIKVTVTDTTAPSFTEFKDKLETVKDVKLDLDSLYKAEDLTEVSINIDTSNIDYSKPGEYKAIITAEDTSKNQTIKEAIITVKEPTIKLNKDKVTLYINDTLKLSCDLDGKDKKVVYSTSDKSVATVDSGGKVKALKEGTVTITASANGVNDKCVITIKKPTVTVSNTIPKGGTVKIKTETFTYPASIPQGNFNDNEYAVLCEILAAIKQYDKEEIQIKTLLKGDFTNAKEILFTIEKIINADINYKSMSVCNEKGVYSHNEKNGYVKIVIRPKSTKKTFDNNKAIYNSIITSIKKAGVTNGMSHKDAVLKFTKWISNHMTYKLNYNSAYEGFVTGTGQCSTYTDMMMDLCEFTGITCQYVQGDAGGPHAWNRVKLNGKWYYLDITWYDSSKNSKYILSEKLWSSHKAEKHYNDNGTYWY